MRRRHAVIALLFITIGWSIALVAAPFGSPRLVAASTYLAGSLVCHQQADRSFYLNGSQLPVCARCFGLYLGAILGVAGWMFIAGLGRTSSRRVRRVAGWRTMRRGLLLAATPTLASVALAWVGMWDGGNVLRAAIALPLGAVVAAIVAAFAAGDLR